jgi:hypothetical protein
MGNNRLGRMVNEIISFPDYQYFWKKKCLDAIYAKVDLENIDIIYSTSSPVTCHLIAKELKRKHGIPGWLT